MTEMNAQPTTEQVAWLDLPLAERAQRLRFMWAKKDKFGFALDERCKFDYLVGTVRWVSTTGALVHINGGKGIGLIDVPIEYILRVDEGVGED